MLNSLGDKEIKNFLSQLHSDWKINQAGRLCRKFSFKDFLAPMELAHQMTKIAEEQNHHPDLKISWGLLEIEIWTHSINGLSEKDFVLAQKIDALDHKSSP